MSRNYGIPYMGSKSKIVHLIDYIIERHYDNEYFVDVFTGGFAVSHYVLLHKKMKVLANDKNEYVVALLNKVLYEGLPDEVYNFVGREKFFDVINNPDKYEKWYVGYVSTIWSFGNKQTTYLFGQDIEPSRKDFHQALVFNEWEGEALKYEKYIPQKIKELDYKTTPKKRLSFMRIIKEKHKTISEQQPSLFIETGRVQQLERLEQLERLQQLQQLERLQQLESQDWRVFIDNLPEKVLNNAIIYCDPPYEDTAEYAERQFNHDEFWQWFRETPYCVYVSSYKAPDDIKPFNFRYKNQLLAGGVGKTVKENIYWNGKGNSHPTLEDLLFDLESNVK